MATVNEAVQQTADEKAHALLKEQHAKAKPAQDLLHHLNFTKTPKQRVTVHTVDGSAFNNVLLEWVFTDGITIFADEHHRTYMPLTAIRSIHMHNIADAKP